MKTTNKILGIVAFLLLAGAAVTAQRSVRIIRQYRWTVLEEPIRLEDGFSVSRPFTVDVAGTYRVNLECQKTVPFVDEMLATKLAAEYTITTGLNQIDGGNTSQPLGMGYTNDYIERHIATFAASPGIEYNLALRITTSLPEFGFDRSRRLHGHLCPFLPHSLSCARIGARRAALLRAGGTVSFRSPHMLTRMALS